MKLHILSDLHLEFADFQPQPTEADIVILAGDTYPGTKGVAWAATNFPHTPVLYISRTMPLAENLYRSALRGIL